MKNQQVPGDLLGELSRSIKCPSRSPREEPCRAEIRLADAGPLEAQSADMPGGRAGGGGCSALRPTREARRYKASRQARWLPLVGRANGSPACKAMSSPAKRSCRLRDGVGVLRAQRRQPQRSRGSHVEAAIACGADSPESAPEGAGVRRLADSHCEEIRSLPAGLTAYPLGVF